MTDKSENRNPQLNEVSGKWGLIVVLVLVFGLPIIGIILSLMRAE